MREQVASRRCRERCHQGLGVGLIVGLLVGALLAPIAEAGEVAMRDGTPWVLNSSTPAEGKQRLELRELWRTSSEEEEDFLLGRIQQVLMDKDGNYYLLDQQLAQVHVLTGDGTYVHSLSREGDGPGESRRPISLIFTPSGGLGLVQAFPAQVVAIDLEGNPESAIELRGPAPKRSMDRYALRVRYRGGTFAYSGRTMAMGRDGAQPRNMLVTCDTEGSELTTILEKTGSDLMETRRWVEKEEYFVHRSWEIGPGGRLHTAPERDRYAIHIQGADGQLQRVVEREYEARRRTDEEKQDLGPRISSNGEEIQIDAVIGDREPAIRGIHVADSGELWVEHSWSNWEQPEGVWQTLDLFDRDGNYVRQIEFTSAVDRDPENDQLFRVSDDRMVLIKGFDRRISITIGGGGGGDVDVPEEERPPLEVICFAIEPSSSAR